MFRCALVIAGFAVIYGLSPLQASTANCNDVTPGDNVDIEGIVEDEPNTFTIRGVFDTFGASEVYGCTASNLRFGPPVSELPGDFPLTQWSLSGTINAQGEGFLQFAGGPNADNLVFDTVNLSGQFAVLLDEDFYSTSTWVIEAMPAEDYSDIERALYPNGFLLFVDYEGSSSGRYVNEGGGLSDNGVNFVQYTAFFAELDDPDFGRDTPAPVPLPASLSLCLLSGLCLGATRYAKVHRRHPSNPTGATAPSNRHRR